MVGKYPRSSWSEIMFVWFSILPLPLYLSNLTFTVMPFLLLTEQMWKLEEFYMYIHIYLYIYNYKYYYIYITIFIVIFILYITILYNYNITINIKFIT